MQNAFVWVKKLAESLTADLVGLPRELESHREFASGSFERDFF